MAIFDFKSLQFWYSLNFIRVILETSRSLWIAGKWYDLRNSSPTNQQTMTLETNGIQCRAQSYLFIYFFHFKCKCTYFLAWFFYDFIFSILVVSTLFRGNEIWSHYKESIFGKHDGDEWTRYVASEKLRERSQIESKRAEKNRILHRRRPEYAYLWKKKNKIVHADIIGLRANNAMSRKAWPTQKCVCSR